MRPAMACMRSHGGSRVSPLYTTSTPAPAPAPVRAPWRLRVEDVRHAAEKYGPVKDVYIPKDYHTRTFCARPDTWDSGRGLPVILPHPTEVQPFSALIPESFSDGNLSHHYAEKPRGIAFVEFTSSRDCEDAMLGLDRSLICGCEIQAGLAQHGRKKPDQFGGGGGGGGGYRGGGGGGGSYDWRDRDYDRWGWLGESSAGRHLVHVAL
jgi:hypothetical protein